MKTLVCTSCGSNITNNENFVQFKCPNCSKADIIRCSKCKIISNEYRCLKCNFVGP